MWDLEILIHTGIPVVEEVIKEYIEKYAYPIKIKDAVDDILKILTELNMKAKFEKSVAEDSEKLQRVREQIQKAKQQSIEGENVSRRYRDKIRGFGIDKDNGMVKERRKLEKDISMMLNPYKSENKIIKNDAYGMINKFVNKMKNYQEECQRRLRKEMENNIFDTGSQLLEEYKEIVKEMLGSIEVEGYDFGNLVAFKNFAISNLDSIMKNNEQTHFRSETRWKANPERRGFFGWFKFWEPKEISYIEEIPDGKDVDVASVTVSITMEYTNQHNKNIEIIYDQAIKKVEEYKTIFEKNLDNLDEEIRKVLNQLSEDIKESQVIEQRVKKNKELAQWLEDRENEIRKVLIF